MHVYLLIGGACSMLDKINIRGARQHNLKNIDLDLPRRNVIVVTGVSGSGKSSLAFDTIYAEGQRRYIESLSTYARQFIEKLERPDVDEISGISPTIAIRHKNTVTSARSTVGTATEIYDYLRLLFARLGRTMCPECGIEVKSYSPSEVAAEIVSRFAGRRVYLLMPIGTVSGRQWPAKREYFVSRGYSRLLVDCEPVRIEEFSMKQREERLLFVLLDRLAASEANRSRIAEAVELAYRETEGKVEVIDLAGKESLSFTHAPTCSSCGRTFEAPSPLLFSFNSPFGACPECRGFGDKMEFSESLIVSNPKLSLEQRAIDPWSRERFSYFHYEMIDFCRERGIPTDVPYDELSERSRNLIIEGTDNYYGVMPFLEHMREKSYKKGHRFFTRKYMGFTKCRACRGGRLRPEAYSVKIDGRTISELAAMTPSELIDLLEGAPFDERERRIARDLLQELGSRLAFMRDVGLDYLTLDRLTKTLSGGEAQRINLANSLGASLVDALYILDEPSIGLHAADNGRLIAVLGRLKELGNTVLVVEHDPDIIRAADFIVDLGPGPGRNGGEVLYSGTMADARKAEIPASKTMKWLFGTREGSDKVRTRRTSSSEIVLSNVSEHNLKGIDVSIPLGCLSCVTGVSGSGKSTLVVDVLYRVLARKGMAGAGMRVGSVDVKGRVDKVLLVDQSPIGSSPRSNPITYIKGFSYIREAFAGVKTAILRGFKPGRFSFNKPGGRCSRCQGMGYHRVEMHFVADVFVPCEECGGKRFNQETLEIRYKGKDISEVLDLTVDEAILFFDDIPQLGEKLWVLSRVGLGYLKLGQPSNTLSGGEAQRVKIARELAESSGARNLYIMDEPTTGLHMSDVKKLVEVLNELVSAGHTVVVIEHNMEVIWWADYIVDLGPGGGEEGGRVVVSGAPGKIAKSKKSITGRYLERYLRTYGLEA
jgi:excinuclease ABC subunit A